MVYWCLLRYCNQPHQNKNRKSMESMESLGDQVIWCPSFIMKHRDINSNTVEPKPLACSDLDPPQINSINQRDWCTMINHLNVLAPSHGWSSHSQPPSWWKVCAMLDQPRPTPPQRWNIGSDREGSPGSSGSAFLRFEDSKTGNEWSPTARRPSLYIITYPGSLNQKPGRTLFFFLSLRHFVCCQRTWKAKVPSCDDDTGKTKLTTVGSSDHVSSRYIILQTKPAFWGNNVLIKAFISPCTGLPACFRSCFKTPSPHSLTASLWNSVHKTPTFLLMYLNAWSIKSLQPGERSSCDLPGNPRFAIHQSASCRNAPVSRANTVRPGWWR